MEASLSSDMRLLYRCAKAVVNGDATNVSRLRHGKLCMARRCTAQSRLLRHYMSQTAPSAGLGSGQSWCGMLFVYTYP